MPVSIFQVVLGVDVLFLVFEDFSYYMVFSGIISQLAHLSILKNFPYVDIMAAPFIVAVVLFFANHYFALVHFATAYYSLSEVRFATIYV